MTAGPILANVIQACEPLDVNLVYFHTLKPIDREAILRFKDSKIIVVHDAFGLHEAICEIEGVSATYHGLPDRFFNAYGKIGDVHRLIGLDPEGIQKAVRRRQEEKQHA